MRYHNITTDDMRNGDGLRTVLWVAGCAHHCPGCHNPITWDADGGLAFDEGAKAELFEKLKKPYISGVTFSGGDPLHPKNRDEVEKLIKEIRDRLPQKTIWVYTGYTFEEIRDLQWLNLIDVLVDGRYEADKRDIKLHWKGSSNQRVIDMKKTLDTGKITIFEPDYGRDRV